MRLLNSSNEGQQHLPLMSFLWLDHINTHGILDRHLKDRHRSLRPGLPVLQCTKPSTSFPCRVEGFRCCHLCPRPGSLLQRHLSYSSETLSTFHDSFLKQRMDPRRRISNSPVLNQGKSFFPCCFLLENY